MQGWGQSLDAGHLTAPARDGAGLAAACSQALRLGSIERPALIIAHGTGAITTMVFLYPCVAAFGLMGVLVCGLISQLAIVSWFPILLRKAHPEPMRLGTRWLAISFIATAVALVPSFLFHAHPLAWIATFPALIVYGAVMAAAGLLRASDLTNIRSLLRRRKS